MSNKKLIICGVLLIALPLYILSFVGIMTYQVYDKIERHQARMDQALPAAPIEIPIEKP